MSKVILCVSGFLVFTFSSWAFAGKGHHRQMHAHVHGGGKSSLAFDGETGEFRLTASAESIVGFEHKPKNKKQRDQINEALGKIESQIGEMVILEKSLNCQWSKKKIDVNYEGNHSEIEAEFKVQCAKSPQGSSLEIRFAQIFPALKDVDMQILINDIQKSIEVGPQGQKLMLQNEGK